MMHLEDRLQEIYFKSKMMAEYLKGTKHRNMKELIAMLGYVHLLGYISSPNNRPPDKSAYWKTIIFISQPKHMLWVLKRTIWMSI